MKCNFCGKPATVHLTQIVNNQIHKMDLCETCAAAKGVTDPNGFSLADLLLNPSATSQPSTAENRCEDCGCTLQDFRKSGRLGCPDCYEHFSVVLDPMLHNMHKGTAHRGKVPRHSLQRVEVRERIQHLEHELQTAVAAENYEEAAKFRDQIRDLRATTSANPMSA